MKRFTVDVEGIYHPDGEEGTYTVYAPSVKEAIKKALKRFENDFYNDFDEVNATVRKKQRRVRNGRKNS